jgi:hypothetical protein
VALYFLFAAFDREALAGLMCIAAVGAGGSGLILASDGGTPASSRGCDPNYSGACLKSSASDYDCAGGEGDGPSYVDGPVTVKGSDPFGLDRDGDGTGCD